MFNCCYNWDFLRVVMIICDMGEIWEEYLLSCGKFIEFCVCMGSLLCVVDNYYDYED